MARIRTIKPEFWTDEKIVELSAFARLLYIGLWNFCDDEGRMVYSQNRIKMQILPADSLQLSELIGEIRGKSMITVYVVDNIEYLQVNCFSKHQKIDKRTASKYPSPPISPEFPRLPPTEGKGMEGNGREPLNPQTSNHQTPTGLNAPTKKSAIALKTFIEECKAKGERPLRDYTSLWTYTKAVGLSEEFVALAWAEFCRRFMPTGAQAEKRQKDWRCTFRKYVENNYFKLWAIDQHGTYFLTTLGKQAEKFQEVAA